MEVRMIDSWREKVSRNSGMETESCNSDIQSYKLLRLGLDYLDELDCVSWHDFSGGLEGTQA